MIQFSPVADPVDVMQLRAFGIDHERRPGYWGTMHHHAVICAGLRGTVSTRHGAPDQWDWGRTLWSYLESEKRNDRMQKLADSLTPEQKAALWGATDEWAKKLRRFVR